MEHTKNSNDQPSNDESDSRDRQYAGTFVGRRMHAQNQAESQARESSEHERKIMPTEFEVVMAFLRRSYSGLQNVSHDRILAWFTVGIFFATAVYAAVAIAQWKVMRKSNEINREALTSVQRAFISFMGIDPKLNPLNMFDPSHPIPQTLQFVATFQNSGATGARYVRMYGTYANLPSEQSLFTFKPPLPPPNTKFIPAVFGPKETHSTTPIQINIPPPGNFTEIIVFWGWIAYRDAFDNTPWHLTEYCRTLNDFAIDKHTGAVKTYYRTCPNFNCTDDDCENYTEVIKRVEFELAR